VQIKSREKERKTPASRWKDLKLRIGRLLQGDLLNGFLKCVALMEVLQSMSIHFEALVSGVTLDFNNTIGKNISNIERTNPPRTKLTGHEFEAGIEQ